MGRLDPVSETYDTNANIDPYISKEAIAAFRDLYIEDESDLINPYASPVYGNYEGFPPLTYPSRGKRSFIG